MTDKELPTWNDAAKILALNPRAQVSCPTKGDGDLVVFDVRYKDQYIDRYLVCPVCGARNIITIKISNIRSWSGIIIDSSGANTLSISDIVRSLGK